jgi:hypothetical protein
MQRLTHPRLAGAKLHPEHMQKGVGFIQHVCVCVCVLHASGRHKHFLLI